MLHPRLLLAGALLVLLAAPSARVAAQTSANLSLGMSVSPDPVGCHHDLTYTLGIDNAGPDDALGVTLTQTLPTGVVFVSSNPGSPACAEVAGVVTCSLGDLPEGEGAVVTVVVQAQSPGMLDSTAGVASTTNDPDPSDNDASAQAGASFLKGDLDNDLNTDLVIADTTTNQHHVWFMVGVTRVAEMPVSPTPPASASNRVYGVDDFDGDFRNDLVHWNSATGAVEFWLMDGVNRIGSPVPLSGAPTLALNWKLSATGDFDSDGQPDIVWRNTVSQKIVIWTMNGTAKVGSIVPTPDQAVHANWEIVAALDLNADGNRDLLWYNATSGKIVYWWMDASVVRITGNFTNPPNAGDNNWKVLAGGDYGVGLGGGAATNDLVWRNASSGKFVVWYLDTAGNRTGGVFTFPDQPDGTPTDWTIVGPR